MNNNDKKRLFKFLTRFFREVFSAGKIAGCQNKKRNGETTKMI